MKRVAAIKYLNLSAASFDLAVQTGRITPDARGEFNTADLDSYKATQGASNALAIVAPTAPVIARPEPLQPPRLPIVPVHERLTLSISEAAALAGVSRATVLRAIAAGELPVFAGVARGRKVRRCDVAKWVEGWKVR